MIFHAHSGVRYLVLLAGLVVLGYALYGLVRKREFDETMRKLGGLFAGLLHLNVLLGLGLLFTRQFYPQLAGHILMMVFAAVVAQIVPSVMRRRPVEKRSYGPYVVSTLVALALVVGGVMAIGRTIV